MLHKHFYKRTAIFLALLFSLVGAIFFNPALSNSKIFQAIAQNPVLNFFDRRRLLASSIFSDKDVEFSFVVIGCNRVDKADLNANNPSTANIEQLNRTFQEVAQLSPPPKFLFFAGDLVFGYTKDTEVLESQLRAWLDLYKKSALAGSPTTLIPIPGNHEVQDDKKVAFAGAEQTWLKVMAPYLRYGGNGPKAGGEDGLKTDQSSLTYSFDYKDTHFVLLDTDPVGKDWSVPTKWIAQDLSAAKARDQKHIFAIGHKPAIAYPKASYDPPAEKEDGLGRIYPKMRDEFWQSLVDHKAEAMLASHEHIYRRVKGPGGDTWQITAGNGGSIIDKISDTQTASNNFYGFTQVEVHNDARVIVKSYGRDIPAAGYMTPSSAPSTIRDQGDISQPK
jgi:hypothetical protein